MIRCGVFFDLDRTLMEGSSAFQFGRAAYKAGLLSRRQLLTDAWANLQFRLHGSTDADTQALRERISARWPGRACAISSDWAPTCWRGCCRASIPRC